MRVAMIAASGAAQRFVGNSATFKPRPNKALLESSGMLVKCEQMLMKMMDWHWKLHRGWGPSKEVILILYKQTAFVGVLEMI